jgi:signal transduction histidine kinase/ligand-binding sensor domain-containing protein/DNA-binding response OmpR family regulator
MSLHRYIVILISFLISTNAFAQQDQIQFSRIDLSNGLSHNQVNSILKDSKGFLWFGTLSGLNRYDGYEFKTFKHEAADTTSIVDDFVTDIYELPDHKLYLETRSGPNIYDNVNQRFIRNVKAHLSSLGIKAIVIRDILRDSDGNFWFNAVEQGIFKYNVSTKKAVQYRVGTGQTGISAIQQGPNGNIWVIHRDESVEMLDRKSGKVLQRIDVFKKTKPAEYQDFKVFVDQSSSLWIYTMNYQHGIDYYDPQTKTSRYIDKGPSGLNNNLINGIIQDTNGRIWIGTDHGGVNLLDKRDFKIRYLVNREDDQKSISQNSITRLYKDPAGIVWIGTFKKGLSYYHPQILKFPVYRHRLSNPNGLTYDDVNRFVEDDAGNLWIGTNGGGLFYFNRKTGSFKKYAHEAANPNSLSNDIIVSLYIDKQKVLWIGTYFGGLDRFDGKTFKHYRHIPGQATSLSDDRVWDILEDRKGRLLVGTLLGGLNILDRKTGAFTHKQAGQPNSVGSNTVTCLLEDVQGNVWIGTSDGVDQLRMDGRILHYSYQVGNANSLVNNIVYDIMQDSYGFIWFATKEGLSRLNAKTGRFMNFGKMEGLTEQATLKILEDNNRNLWLSTANGLFKILVRPAQPTGLSYTFRKYDELDGLQGSAFNANAGYKTRSGELVFGGANGFNLFKPSNIKNDSSKPELVISNLQIGNKTVGINESVNGRILLDKSIEFTKNLNLKYKENGLTFEFAALNFFSPRKIKYRYKLEGFDKHWQELQGDIRRATYTNIDPGDYTFRVVSTDASGNWVNNETNLRISITPPFWRTKLAYLVYVFMIGGTLYLMRRRGIQRAREEFMLEQERQQARRLHDLDLLKIKFLTNVSHEFRTPLSLIISPLERLIQHAQEAEKPQLQMIQRNGRRLLNLVNQLLDFRRMEVQELKLHPKRGDIIVFLQELCLSFGDVADRKNIELDFATNKKSLITHFDYDKIERILFNVLSNAFKFTPQGGKVAVEVVACPPDDAGTKLLIRIQDTGIGIDPAKKDLIFERFFQSEVPDSMVNQGTGIGLSITKEFVKLHGGTIEVESALNIGSTFTINFVFKEELQEMLPELEKRKLLYSSSPEPLESDTAIVDPKSKKPVVMLVEDNDDFRFYLKDNLKAFYQVVEAVNGKEGWQRVLSLHPDLVVSDVSMPEMDGIELCKKIKSDKRTAHLPVILLTALTNEAQQLTGLETGASDYMTKPFNFEILLSKIRNLLQQQALSKKTYQKQVAVKPVDSAIESVDDRFIRQLCLHIEKHLSDSAYSVDQLSADMNMSRVGLYKKILPLTGKSPVEYIRYYRLQKSKPLLESQLSISEVAYQVGFSNPKHFSKYFKQEFNILPSAYAGENAAKRASI